MLAFGQQMSRLLLVLVVASQLASLLVECSSGKDPDDYDDLEEDDEDYIIEVEDLQRLKADTDRPKPEERLSTERYYQLIRPRLGHFERFPELRKLYEDYFEKSMKRRDATMSKISKTEDWRYYRPTPEFCVSFLNIFKSKKYMINKPIDIIPLDACLEWIFLDRVDVPKDHPDYERTDRAVHERALDVKQIQSSWNLGKTENLRADETLESIYRDTLFSRSDVVEVVDGKKVMKDQGVPKRMRLKLKKYLLRLLDIHDQNPGKGCHSLWLDAYTSFMEQVYLDCAGQADCEHFGDQLLDEDRYFRLVAESTRQSSINCYNTMQSSILSLMEKSYNSKAGAVFLTRAKKFGMSKLEREYEEQKWSREMVKILQLVSGQEPDKPISLGEVVRKLWEIKSGDEDESARFLKALGEYAIANADMKATSDDPQGVKRYARAMTRICKPYIDEKLFLVKAGAIDLDEEEIKNKEPFLFYHIIYSLIRLTNHESIYDITKDQFERDVLKNKWEALYLTTFACQMMSTTTGELSADTNENAYEVSFQYDSVQYVEDWPLELMNEKLVKVAGKADQSTTIEPKRSKLSFKSKQTKSPEAELDEDDKAEPAAGLWTDYADNAQQKGKKGRHTGYGSSISSKLKKTFGKFKFGGSSSSSSSKSSSSKSANGQKFIMSEEMIRKFHENYKYWPVLPDNIREIYPNLPPDCLQNNEQQAGLKSISGLMQQPAASPIIRPAVSPVLPVAPAPAPMAPAQPSLPRDDGLPSWPSAAQPQPQRVEAPRRPMDMY